MSITNVNVTTASTWVNQHWDDVDVAAYEEMVLANLVDTRKKLQGQLTVPFHANLSAAAVSAGNASSLMFSGATTEGSAVLTPTAYSAQVEVELPLIVRAVQDPEGFLQESLRKAIVAITDVQVATKVASLATNLVSCPSGIDKPSILTAIKLGAQGGKEFWRPGKSNPYCVVHVGQVDNILGEGTITSAQIRGDSANPVVSGWVARAFGVDFYESGNIYTSGGSAYSVMAIKRALAISYNQRPKIELQQYQMTVRIICWTDFGTNIIRDGYAIALIHPAT